MEMSQRTLAESQPISLSIVDSSIIFLFTSCHWQQERRDLVKIRVIAAPIFLHALKLAFMID